ncbi:hypothetical protein [Leifsonia sp. NPDC080035]|uniref:Ribbon-helix-helix protein CopG domain-containing protein n=1 Tax=Leifsonia sp. NPDC080035 TaxID=3143936 RepID=A0AAU7GA09_9MICO
MSESEITGATTLGPGHVPGGIPLKIRLSEADLSALARIAKRKDTTAAALVEQLVLGALAHAEVPAAAESTPKRRHTTYEQATSGYRAD